MIRNCILVVASTLISLGIIELSLRAQEELGPIIQLSDFAHSLDLYSPRVHHRSAKEKTTKTAGPADCSAGAVTILFLGDSWIEDGGVIEGFADYIDSDSKIQHCFELINGGVRSYSPSLILLHGITLSDEYTPDIVIVNIDETDLMDEYLRYAYSSVYDDQGQLLAVVPSLPDVPTIVFEFGFVTLEEQPLYLLRLLEKVYFTRVFMPRLLAAFDEFIPEPSYEHLFGPQLSKDPRAEYASAIAHFRERLSGMILGLSASLGSADRLVLTHHPHFLQVAGTASLRYNTIVGDILEDAADRHGVRLYDAVADYSTIHDIQHDRVFFWPDDLWSHLTYTGSFNYGRQIARVHAEMLRATARD